MREGKIFPCSVKVLAFFERLDPPFDTLVTRLPAPGAPRRMCLKSTKIEKPLETADVVRRLESSGRLAYYRSRDQVEIGSCG
jgi:hypothetical protein